MNHKGSIPSIEQMNNRSTEYCPICSSSSRQLFLKYGYGIRACQSCHHRFAEVALAPTHVEQVYGDEYFQGGGAGYPDYLAEATLLKQQGQRYARLLSRHMQPGTLLDVGAAAGFILQGLVDAGWQGSGIEPNSRMVDYATQQMGLEVALGTLEQVKLEVLRSQYDLITMIQVVGHLYDLQQAFQTADSLTKSNGFWLIESWNRESWTARILGQHWHEYSPPSVLHWFSPNGLQQVAAQFGFREVERGRPAKWINGAHAKSLLQYKLKELPLGNSLSRLVNIIPDYLLIPYPAEDLFWILFQKQ